MGKARALILLCAALGLCRCRLVTVPRGPLLRVEGQPLSLRCDVEDYEGPREQEFEWKVIRETESMNVVSTFDDKFSDRSIKERVSSGDISMSRLGDNVVELRIKEARIADSATYRCSTTSTDSVYSGNYDADVQLKDRVKLDDRVLSRSLLVVPDAVNRVIPEGGSFRLVCNVSYDLMEGIHLSFTWSVIKGPSLSQDLLTVGPGVGVMVGSGVTQRYADGAMRLELGNGASHSVVLSGAMPDDQGMYTCTARLWTREQGTWKRIQEKTVEMGDVTVNPAANSLSVEVLKDSTLSSGESLILDCSVTVDGLTSVDLEVTWLLNDTRVLARSGRDGVLSGASDAVEVRRLGKWDFQLKVPRVDTTDAGFYSCKAIVWIHHSSGRWYEAAEKISAPVRVRVIKHNPDFTVVLSSTLTAKFSGDPTDLECKVLNVSNLHSGRLGVSWLFKDGHDPLTGGTVASLDENGTLMPGKSYASRVEAGLITVTRVEPYTFKLRLLHTTNEDVGEYSCGVTVWIQSMHEHLKMTTEIRSPALKVGFTNKSPVLGVVAQRLREVTASGSTFEMSCRANTQNLPPGTALSVVVLSEASISSSSRKLASLGPEMVLKLEDWTESARRDGLMLIKTSKTEFQFRMSGVQVTDRGFYSCEMKAWSKPSGDDWMEMARGVSNKVQITFEHRDDVAYEVKWFLSRLKGSSRVSLLAGVDRWGVVHKTPRNDSSDCSLERLGPRKFTLNIHSAQDSDGGEYHCTVTPWIQSTGTSVRSQLPEVTSKKISLNVKFAFWDSMKLPLLYGMCASVTVGVFSLVLGLVCVHCCFRSTSSTPRSRAKLLELEMD
ncbi:Prostaglandin F2 receptor negative regulator [Triplophysa tibetana]|uniref:Prostaglandin F2 receptor negative regulator n=1 Tax=Triplophysa tibetana TaxID=1572043 RepID=A0A5A9PLL5_9TELE|nr:Prostaglandin F2 receptor negative regulator [Triplophysa tibetana]